MKHRFKHLIDKNEVLVSDTPTTKIDLADQVFETLEEDLEDPAKGFGDDGFDNYDDDDGDDDDEGDDDYRQDKLTVAEDEKSILSEAKVIFQRDPKSGKTFMVCRVEEWEIPDDIADGKTMFKADIIYRPFGEYSSPKKKLKKINPKLFKKNNWQEKP